jgi:hypothetical protein
VVAETWVRFPVWTVILALTMVFYSSERKDIHDFTLLPKGK